MLYGLYASAAGALANSYRQDVIANNLANVDTVAFKRDLALAMARPTQSEKNGQRTHTAAMLERIGGGTFSLPTYTDFSPAPLRQTGSPFDLALLSRGFFQVLNGSEINYTRDGRFALDQQYRLVTASGRLPVLDDKSQPIVLDPDLPFQINQAGIVSQAGNQLARLGIVDFEDTGTLQKQGKSLYRAPENIQPKPLQATVKQQHLETSDVDPMQQLVDMIKTQRFFQANVTMLQLQDQTLGYAVGRLGNIA